MIKTLVTNTLWIILAIIATIIATIIAIIIGITYLSVLLVLAVAPQVDKFGRNKLNPNTW